MADVGPPAPGAKIAAPLAAFLSIIATALAIVGTATRHWWDWSDDFHRGLWMFGNWGTNGAWSCMTGLTQAQCYSLRVVQAFCIILIVLSFLDVLFCLALAAIPDSPEYEVRKYGVYYRGKPSLKMIVKYLAITIAVLAGGFGAGATGIWVVFWNESMVNFSGVGYTQNVTHTQTIFGTSNVGLTQNGVTPAAANAIVLNNPGSGPIFFNAAQTQGVAAYGANGVYLPNGGLQTVGYTNAYSFILVTTAWVIQFGLVPIALFLDSSLSFDEDVAPVGLFYKVAALTLSVIAVCTNYWKDDGMGQHSGLWMTHQDDAIAGGKWISGLWTCRLTDLDSCEAYQAVQVFMLLDISACALSVILSAIIFFGNRRTFPLMFSQLVFTTMAWGFGLVAMTVWIIFNGYGFGAGLGYSNAGGSNGQSFYRGPNGYSFALNVAAWVINFAVAPMQLWAIREPLHEMAVAMSNRQAAPIATGVSFGALVLSITAATTKHWYEDGVTHKGLWGFGRWSKGAWQCYNPSSNNHVVQGFVASQLSGIGSQQWPAVPAANCDNIRTTQAFVIWEVIFCFTTVVLAFLLAITAPEAKAKILLKRLAIGSAILAAACGMTCTAEVVHDLVPTWKFQGYSYKLMVVAWVAIIGVVPAALYADGANSFGDVVPDLTSFYTFLALVLAVVAACTRYWYDEGVPGGNYFGLWNIGRWDKNGIWYANFGKIHVKNLQGTQIFTLLLIGFLFLALLSAIALTVNRNLVRLQVVTFALLTLAATSGLVAMSIFLGEIAPATSILPVQVLNIYNGTGTRNTGSSFGLLVAAWVIPLAVAPVVLYWSEWSAINHWAAPMALYGSLASLVLSIVGTATNYWFVSSDLNTNAGLWNVGSSYWGSRNSVSQSQWVCGAATPFVFNDKDAGTTWNSKPGGPSRTIYKPFSCDSLKAVQLFALCLIGFSFITFVLTAYVTFTSRKRALPKVAAIMSAFFGGIFGLISMCIFLGEINRNSWHGFQRQVPVGHSFALVTAAWVILLGVTPALLFLENSFFLGCKLEPEEAAQALYNNWAELWAQVFTLSTLVLAIIGTATRHWFDDGVTHLGLWSLGHFEPLKNGSTSSGTWKCTAGRNAYHYGVSNMCNPLRATQAFAIGMIGFAFVSFVLSILLSFEATPQRKKITKERGIAAAIASGVCGMIAMAVYLDDFNPFTVDVFDQNFRNHGYSFNLIVAAWTIAIGATPVAFAMAATREFGEVVAPLTAFYSLIAVVLSVVAVGTNYWWDAGYQGGHYGLWTVGKWITSADWVNGASTGLLQTKWVCNLPPYYTSVGGQTFGKCAADEIAKTFTSLQTVKTFNILLIIFAGFSFLINVFMTMYGREAQMQYYSFFAATLSSISGMIAMAVWLGDIDSWKIGYSLGLEIAAWVVMMWVSVVLVYTQASPQWLAAPFATFFALAATVLAFVGTATNYWMKFGSGGSGFFAAPAGGVFQGVFSASTGWTNGLAGGALQGAGLTGNGNLNGIGGNNAAYYLGLWSWGTWGSNGVWTCINLPNSSSQFVKGYSAECDSIKAVQVFCILLIFMAFLTLVFSAITAFAKGITNFYGVLSPRYAGIISAVLGGLFGIIAMAIWLGEVNSTPVSQQFGSTSAPIGQNQWSYTNNLNNQQYGYGLNGPVTVKDMSWVTNIASQQITTSPLNNPAVTAATGTGISTINNLNGNVVTGILGAGQPVLFSDTLAPTTNLNFGASVALPAGANPISTAALTAGSVIGANNPTILTSGATRQFFTGAYYPSGQIVLPQPIAGVVVPDALQNQNQISGVGYTYNGQVFQNLNAANPKLPIVTTLAGLYNGVSTPDSVLSYATLMGKASTSQPMLGNGVSFALIVAAWVILIVACPALLFLEEQALWVPTISKSIV